MTCQFLREKSIMKQNGYIRAFFLHRKNNIAYCGYSSNLRELSRFAPSPSTVTSVSDKIHARSSLRSSPASFQSASRLYYCSAVPRLASLVESREIIKLCLIRSKNEISKLRKIFSETPLANFHV